MHAQEVALRIEYGSAGVSSGQGLIAISCELASLSIGSEFVLHTAVPHAPIAGRGMPDDVNGNIRLNIFSHNLRQPRWQVCNRQLHYPQVQTFVEIVDGQCVKFLGSGGKLKLDGHPLDWLYGVVGGNEICILLICANQKTCGCLI